MRRTSELSLSPYRRRLSKNELVHVLLFARDLEHAGEKFFQNYICTIPEPSYPTAKSTLLEILKTQQNPQKNTRHTQKLTSLFSKLLKKSNSTILNKTTLSKRVIVMQVPKNWEWQCQVFGNCPKSLWDYSLSFSIILSLSFPIFWGSFPKNFFRILKFIQENVSKSARFLGIPKKNIFRVGFSQKVTLISINSKGTQILKKNLGTIPKKLGVQFLGIQFFWESFPKLRSLKSFQKTGNITFKIELFTRV